MIGKKRPEREKKKKSSLFPGIPREKKHNKML